MVLTVTEDTPADMLAGSMELLVQLPRENHLQTQRVTVQRSTPMMDLLVQIATAHKLPASSYTLQAIGERGMVLPHQPNTPIGALDALQVKLLPKQGTLMPRKAKQANQPFETTFRLQVHLPRNQLYVSRVSPKMNLGEILDEVCREKNLDKNKYELRHPGNLETLDLSLSLQDYHLQEVTLYAKQGRTLGSGLSTQDIMVLQRQEERRRQQAKQGVFSFVFKKSKEGSLSTDSLGGRSASPARSDETGRSTSPLQPPARPQRKRRPAPKPPTQAQPEVSNSVDENSGDPEKDKVVISHSRNSSDSSGYHEASVLSDNPDSAGRLPETLPRRNKAPLEIPRKLAHTSQSSKSLCNLASVSGTLSHGISSTSLSSTGRKKRTAPPPPVTRPLSSAISTQALERIVDSEESLTSDMDPSKPPSDIGAPSKANSDIEDRPKASSDIGVTTLGSKISSSIDFTKEPEPERKNDLERQRSGSVNVKLSTEQDRPVDDVPVDARVSRKRDNFSKTDALLQKVSDTLSSSLPETSVSPTEVRKVEPSKEEAEAEKKKKSIVCPEESRINSSTPNLTVSSQQDTSDYVSAADEDLSAVEWEYQLPAPPSAFRDSQSPVFDKFEAPEEPKPIETSNDKDRRKTSEKPEIRDTKVNEIQKDTPQEKSLKQQKSELNLKKEVISELENKIGTLPQSSKELDSKKAINHPSTPKIAPVDNTLSNFTITTYSRQKNLNIFEEVQEQSRAKNDDRFIKSFATLARNRSNSNDNEDRTEKEFDVGTLQGKKRVEEDGKKLEPKIQPEPLQRWQNEKSNVQRSKSSVSEKPVLKLNVKEILKTEKDSEDGEQEDKKRSNEKFSQWRENILKRQENPTKEKQLQSIQVMKSILPQLKNAQQAEENVPKESIDTVLIEKTRSETASNDHSTESNVVPTREPNKLEAEMRKPSVENKAKRYTYSGPPTINLGSWSERPTANVQIKMDTDYKFGIKPINNNNNNRTVININTTSKDEVDASNIESSVKQRADVPSNELTKKLITHTTATGFKRPVLNKINPEPRKSNDKPIVTGVELKKGFAENKDDDVIDTSPLNFKELTKAFGQDVCLRPKSKRSNTIHRSDSNLENDSRKQNGCVNTDALTNGHQEKPRRFTSVVGIQAPGTLLFRNGLAAKGPVPVVKGFKIPTAREEQSNSKVDVSKEPKVPQPPRPPTMPVITGVTLKSARPKSMPVQTDRRDVLLESIRNFGGRENLKSASGIYRT
ncbi:cordon-bleu protein-like 1 isoform X3 [Ceratina calcarata]|uniref:Cordon-bleu protein-like 1 isoform X3 n=1 Tax=Ceratina calcarata TaxID=156304 RepID=A0AAJ7S3I9_9HYME|nr:cordon-bleu protein-like 1 isoform X3 [Ceratina calcarata]